MIKPKQDIRDLIRFMAEINMLIKVAIGSGLLSLLNIFFELLQRMN